MSDIQVTSVDGSQINVSTGTVIGPLPSLQLAAGSGINIANAGGVSTISANLAELSIPANLADLADVSNVSVAAGQVLAWDGAEWGASNIPPGTTVNGLSGDVSLVAGDGVNIATTGTNLTLSATANLTGYATEQFVLERIAPGVDYESPRDATLVQTYDGRQHYSWTAPDSYAGGYTLEIAEVGVTQDISGAGQYTTQSDGSVNLTIQMDTTTAARVFVFASPTGADEDYVPIPYTVAEFENNEVVVEGLYLTDEFASAGTHSLLAAVLDFADEEIGTVQSQPITFGSHGSPQPPEFFSIDAMGLEITANVESTQTPHMLGFYPLDQITYYLEINQQPDATSGWIRGTGVAATESIVPVSATATEGGEWYARVVAGNPQGFGPASEPVQVSGDP